MSSNIHYINEPPRQRSIGDAISETKEELKQFVQTRVAMFQSEMKDKVSTIKSATPMLLFGALVALTAFFVLTAALIALVYVAFAGSLYAVFLACLIVGVLFAIVGGGALLLGYKNIKAGGLMPERTIRLLKEDKIWFQNEARNQS